MKLFQLFRGLSQRVCNSLMPVEALTPGAFRGIEALEPRALLTGAAPTFIDFPFTQVLPTDGKLLTIGIDGNDIDNDALTITAVSDDPNVQITIPTGDLFAKLHFVQSNSVTPIGDVVVQLFSNSHPASAAAIERFLELSTARVTDDIKALAIKSDGSIWAIQDSGGNDILVNFDPATGNASYKGQIKVANANTNIIAMDFDAAGNLIGYNDPVGNANASLVIINTSTPGTSVLRGEGAAGTVAEGLAGFTFQPATASTGNFLSIGLGANNSDELRTSTTTDFKPTTSLGTLGDDYAIKGLTVTPAGLTYAVVDVASVLKLYQIERNGTGNVTAFRLIGNITNATGGAIKDIRAIESTSTGSLRIVGSDATLTNPTQQRLFQLNLTDANSDGTTDGVSAVPLVALRTGANPFYSNVKVHRVVPGFVIQTGDFASGNGTGGSVFGKFNDNFDTGLSFAGPGALAMANSGANTNDSQWFITDAPTASLNGKHMIFGQMVGGLSVYKTIIGLPTKGGTGSDKEQPVTPPLLKSVELFQDTQDTAIEFKALAGWDGTASITVKLDDGHGNVTTKVLSLHSQAVVGNRPTIPTLNDVTITPGTEQTINTNITDDSTGLPLDVTAITTFPGVTATIDAATNNLKLKVPADFSGQFQVTLTAVEKGFTPGALTPTSKTFIVTSRDAGDPAILNLRAIRAGGTAYASQVVGNLMYVAAGASGLEIYDISNINSPTLLGSFDTPGNAIDVLVSGTTAFVADYTGGVSILNVTSPTSISQTSRITPTGGGSNTLKAAVNLAISPNNPNVIFVAESGLGLAAYDITNPANVVKIGSITNVFPGVTSEPAIVDVILKDNFAFISDNRGAVEVIDVTNPVQMKFVTAMLPGNSPWGIELVGDVLYIADRSVGLVRFNVKNPLKPKGLGSLRIAGNPWQVVVTPQAALVGSDTGYTMVDITGKKPAISGFVGGLGFGYRPAVFQNRLALPQAGFGVFLADGSQALVTKSRTFNDSTGKPVTISITGGGSLAVTTTGFQTGDIQDITVTGSTAKTAITIKTATGQTTSVRNITVTGPIKSITATTTNITGNIAISGQDAKGVSLATLSARSITNSNITAPGTLGIVKVTNAVTGTTVRTNGDINSLIVGALINSKILVAVDQGVATLPAGKGAFAAFDADDDTTADPALLRSLKSLIIKGITGAPATDATFANSIVAAWKLGTVTLRVVDTTNDGIGEGLASGTLTKYSRLSATGTAIKPAIPATGPATVETEGDYRVSLL